MIFPGVPGSCDYTRLSYSWGCHTRGRLPRCAQHAHFGGAAIPLQSPLALCAPGTAPAPEPAQSGQESSTTEGETAGVGEQLPEPALLMGRASSPREDRRAGETCCLHLYGKTGSLLQSRRGSGTRPWLAHSALSMLQAGCHIWSSSSGQRIPQIALACAFPHPAFLQG